MDQENLEQVEREIEISIEAARETVERKDMMNELIRDKRFEQIFSVGYFEQEPARLVSLLADPDWQTTEKQEDLLNDMRAISSLRQYIMGIKTLGRQMEMQIARSQTELDNLRTEGE